MAVQSMVRFFRDADFRMAASKTLLFYDKATGPV